jgi:hypothetical protein
MITKSEAGYALQEFIKDVGIPMKMYTDGAKELTLGKWRDICRESNIRMTQVEKGSPWQNRTKVEIRELKRHIQ